MMISGIVIIISASVIIIILIMLVLLLLLSLQFVIHLINSRRQWQAWRKRYFFAHYCLYAIYLPIYLHVICAISIYRYMHLSILHLNIQKTKIHSSDNITAPSKNDRHVARNGAPRGEPKGGRGGRAGWGIALIIFWVSHFNFFVVVPY